MVVAFFWVVEDPQGRVFVLDGIAARSHEWEFRAKLCWTLARDEAGARTMSLAVDAALTAVDTATLYRRARLDRLMGSIDFRTTSDSCINVPLVAQRLHSARVSRGFSFFGWVASKCGSVPL